ncbi:MFS transporter [uncultured Sphingomonas sp.]|uniref:MFS transporter n=1 Tax=uncultured Sphingomonas sp. TaxID=158754 RepID=UPI0035CA9EFD
MATSLRQTMDSAPISPLQWRVATMLTCVFLLEGMDFQSAAYSAPILMTMWHLGKLQFSPLLAAAAIGMAIGTIGGSWAADRYGRKPTLTASVAFFGLLTIVCAGANGPNTFMLVRFVSGLGFGAAFPTAIAMMGEWMPRRAAPKAVSVMTIGIPGGIILGAIVAGWFLPNFGWRWFFVAVGSACVLFSLLLLTALPESPSYLVLRGRQAELRGLLGRAWGSAITLSHGPFELARLEQRSNGLLKPKQRRTSIGLWVASLAANLGTYTMGAWLTVVLTGFKLPLVTALRGPITYSSFAILGGLSVGWVISRLGTRAAMLSLVAIGFAGAAFVSLAIAMVPMGSSLLIALFGGLAVIGLSIGALLPAAYVVAASAYETEVRSRGVGVMSAIGRVGSILSGFLGGAILASAPPSAFFALIAGLIAVIGIGVLVINHHVARLGYVDRAKPISP